MCKNTILFHQRLLSHDLHDFGLGLGLGLEWSDNI